MITTSGGFSEPARPDVPAAEIADDLRAALKQIESVLGIPAGVCAENTGY